MKKKITIASVFAVIAICTLIFCIDDKQPTLEGYDMIPTDKQYVVGDKVYKNGLEELPKGEVAAAPLPLPNQTDVKVTPLDSKAF